MRMHDSRRGGTVGFGKIEGRDRKKTETICVVCEVLAAGTVVAGAIEHRGAIDEHGSHVVGAFARVPLHLLLHGAKRHLARGDTAVGWIEASVLGKHDGDPVAEAC